MKIRGYEKQKKKDFNILSSYPLLFSPSAPLTLCFLTFCSSNQSHFFTGVDDGLYGIVHIVLRKPPHNR